MVNAVMNNIMFFKIANHSITVVGSDGAYNVLNTSTSDYIAISPGQTMDFLFEANQPPSHYYMAARPYSSGGMSQTTTTTGIIEYRGNYTPPSSPFLPTLPAVNDTSASFTFTKQLKSLVNPVDVPLNITDEFFFTLSINTRPCPNNSCNTPSGERLLASVNNITMQLPRISFLQAYYRGMNGVYDTDFPDNPPFPYNYTADNIPIELWRPQNGTKATVLEYNSTVEIVFQGTKHSARY
ncbi:UNVERIFIED_CONTAM: Laccase-14 [Sesamum calycinum]|uniref:Laccase-14 n=1 Tax=Sesamum calycinum TaxID=2727403 RepID=A0AAW2PBD0_9LAMI